MKLKTQLTFYNIIIITISAILILGIFNYFINNLLNSFYNIDVITVDHNAVLIKDILLKNTIPDEINNKIAKYNYSLYIYDKTKLIYGKINPSLAKIMHSSNLSNQDIKIIFIDNKTGVIKKQDNKTFIALQNTNGTELVTIANSNKLATKFLKLSIVSITSVILIAIFFSKKAIKRVMKPVKLLSEGAKRIEQGNYDQMIDYQGNDELKIVINNFNDMQRALKTQVEKNKSYELAKKEMIDGISHDIRTPLTAVKGHIKGLQDGIAKTKEKQEEYLKIAYNRTLEIENLLNQLFDTFNYETGELKLNKTKVNLERYIKEYFKNREKELKNNSLTINISKLPKPIYLNLDKTQFKRILENLFNNSLKYSKKTKLKIDINIWSTKNTVKISYKDNGKGVKKENLPYLFNEFWKEDYSRNHIQGSGSGLGLFIVKTIVEAHNGTIIAENKKGLYFEITIQKEDKNA